MTVVNAPTSDVGLHQSLNPMIEYAAGAVARSTVAKPQLPPHEIASDPATTPPTSQLSDIRHKPKSRPTEA